MCAVPHCHEIPVPCSRSPPCHRALARRRPTGGARMNRFTLQRRDVREDQIYRDALLAQPPEFFLTHFGMVPDMMEKLRFVEKLIQKVGAPQVFANDVYSVRLRHAAPFI